MTPDTLTAVPPPLFFQLQFYRWKSFYSCCCFKMRICCVAVHHHTYEFLFRWKHLQTNKISFGDWVIIALRLGKEVKRKTLNPCVVLWRSDYRPNKMYTRSWWMQNVHSTVNKKKLTLNIKSTRVHRYTSTVSSCNSLILL